MARPARSTPLLVVALAACTTTEAADGEARRIAIDNRSGAPLQLLRAVRDGWQDVPRQLDDAPHVELTLPPGRYALQLGVDGPRVPLPLPPAELGYVVPPVTALTVWPWPADEPGWCWIPPGPGLRGDELGVGQEDERPLAAPTLAGFWLATHETTNAQFTAFLNAIDARDFEPRWLDLDSAQCRIRRDAATGAFVTDAPDLPVVTVSWHGAVAYCDWRTAVTGIPHRLPTETEWEKAARGPGSRVFAYGDTCRAAAANQASGRLRAVGSYAANGFGLRDMTGNVFEWTADEYAPDAYAAAHSIGEPGYRALRGGSFVLDGVFLRNAMRMRLRPEVRADDTGFRVLRENVDASRGPAETPP